MKSIQIKIVKFEKGRTMLVDEHPIVNDDSWVDISKTPSTLTYVYNDCTHHVRGHKSKDELVSEAVSNAVFDIWFEDNMSSTFEDIGLPVPKLYDYEEGDYFEVRGIDNFVNNCRFDDCYDDILKSLCKIAESEYDVQIIDCC